MEQSREQYREQYKVEQAPPTVYYIQNFISEEDAAYLWQQVYTAPRPKWTQLSHRRLQSWGGIPHPKGMVVEDLPKWLLDCCSKVSSLGLFEEGKAPNHVLVNEYTPGQGIMPHEDGPLYYPVVATISLGSTTILDVYSLDNRNKVKFSLLLEPRSLLVLQQEMYTKHLHGITERSEDTVNGGSVYNLPLCKGMCDGDTLPRSTRVSLTIRHVPKTLRVKLKLGQ